LIEILLFAKLRRKRISMTRLSVNVNKIATLRNSRGGNRPDLIKVALDCERFGAEGITVHPRPDERHIRYADVRELKKVVTTEFNIEGNPESRFVDLVLEVVPDQVTLVPDEESAITSDAGWDTFKYQTFLKDIISTFKSKGIRVSVFVDANKEAVRGAAQAGADRVEFYTGPYAHDFATGPENAAQVYIEAAEVARDLNMGVNAGHDLDLENLHFLIKHIPWIDEVSIGHALISDALYYGLENTIQMYRKALQL
jgi:pyridoxine 5-phosphate synthase